MRQYYDEDVKRMTPPQLAAVTAVGLCALAFVVKFWLAAQSGMIVVWAAAWHVLAGLLYALLMLGILYTPDEQPVEDVSEAEREYLQYQSGIKLNVRRYEAIIALLGSAGLLAVAYFVFSRVLAAEPAEPARLGTTLVGLAVVVFAMQFLARFTERIGERHESPGLVATSFHARTDMFATGLALLAVIIAAMGFAAERLFAGLVGLLLVADAAQLFVDATRRLVGLEEDSPTAQLPFWVRMRNALREYAQQMPPIVRWLLRYDDALTAAELRQAKRIAASTVLVLYLLSGCKTVKPGEVGAVKFLGRFVGLKEPGAVYALWPFGDVRIEPIDRVQRVTVGFKTAQTWAPHAENRPFAEMRWHPDEDTGAAELFTIDNQASKFMLGDQNVVEVHLAATYRVRHDDREQLSRYLFGIEDPARLVETVAREAMQSVFLRNTLDAALVGRRSELEQLARSLMQTRLDSLDASVLVDSVMIRSIHPPVEVIDAFVEVASAQELMDRDIHEARSEEVKKVETAGGQAVREVNNAEAEKLTRISEAQGATAAFRQMLQAAAQDAEAVRARLQIEAEEQVLADRPLRVLPPGRSGTRTNIWLNNARGLAGPMVPSVMPGLPPPDPANAGPAADAAAAAEAAEAAENAPAAGDDGHGH